MRKKFESITIRQWKTDSDLQRILAMLVQAYRGQSVFSYERSLRAHTLSPYRKREFTRLIELDGEIVSHLQIQPNFVRIGQSKLWIAGIAGVGTHPDYRKRGLASILLNDTVEFMKEHGFDICVLFGIPNFYRKFGYVPIFPTYSLNMEVDALPRLKRHHRVRKFRSRDVKRAACLQTRTDASTVCSVIRTPNHWKYRQPFWKHIALVEDNASRLRGMINLSKSPKQLIVTEVAAVPDSTVYETVLKACADKAKRAGLTEIRFQIPPDHPFALYCAQFGAQLKITYPVSGGGSGRIVDLRSTFEHMVPEWTVRLQNFGLKGATARISFKTDIGDITLVVRRGRIEICESNSRADFTIRLPQGNLCQLLVGYVGADSLCLRTPSHIHRILQVLFPRLFPHMWATDRF